MFPLKHLLLCGPAFLLPVPAVQASARVDSSGRAIGEVSSSGEKREAPLAAPAVAASRLAPRSGGTGFFQNYSNIPTGAWPEAVAIGDANSDGRNDVLMVNSAYGGSPNDNKLLVFTQKADGTLNTPVGYGAGSAPQSIDMADFNSDGLLDVVVGNGSTAIRVFLQNGSGTFDPMVSYNTAECRYVKVGDFNSDGLPDVVSATWGSNKVAIHLNTGTAFSAPVLYNVTHGGYDELETGDVNHDGRDDVIVKSGQSYAVPNIGVLLQNSGGTLNAAVYYDLGFDENANGAAVGDVTGDGRQDVVISYGGNSPNGKVAVFPQNAGGTLNSSPSVYSSYDIPGTMEIADINGDGRRDLVTLHGGWTSMGVYPQAVGGTLGAEQLFTIPYASSYNGQGLALGDINGDGAPDAAIADYNNGLVLLYNNSPSVKRISRSSPATALAGAGTVTFDVEFSRPVTMVDAGDFALTTTGGQGGAAITSVAAAPGFSHYLVTVQAVAGESGSIRLNFTGAGSVMDPYNMFVHTGRTGDEAYLIDGTAPSAEVDASIDGTQAGPTLTIPFTAADEGGAGMASVALWVKVPGGAAFTNTGLTATGTSGVFNYTVADGNGTYRFAVTATDTFGNAEADPAVAEASVSVNSNPNTQFTWDVVTGSEVLVFPMTDDLDVTITLTVAPPGPAPGATVTVSRTASLSSPPSFFRNPNLLIDEALHIESTGLGTFTAEFEWSFDPASAGRLGAFPINTVYQFENGSHVGTYSVTPSGNRIKVTGVNGFSDWYAGNVTAVPVSVSGFEVE